MTPARPSPRRQRGLSLTELMVAVTIGLFIAGVVMALYLNTRTGFRYLENAGRLQEAGRFALDLVGRDIRMAGYNGCGRTITDTANVVNGAESNIFLDFSTPIRGYEGGVDTFPSTLTAAGAVSGTDAIILLGVDTSNELVVQRHVPVSAQIDTNQHSIKPGEILLITDCAKASIFQMTGPTNNNNNATNVVHNTGTGTPGNCYKELGTSCSASALSYQYKPGSSLLRIYSNAYFVAPASSGGSKRSLWTLALQGTTGGSSQARELIEGVENMQIAYGLDDNPVDGSADKFVTANGVGSGNWSKVVSVRISLLLRSPDSSVATGTQTYTYPTTAGSIAESSVTPGDSVLRKVFSATVAARNRTM